MDKYVIVSDATLDLPMDIIREYDIRVIPMGVNIDDTEYIHYPDEREITVEEFYGKLKDGAVPRTSQITPAVFAEFFTDILEQGLDIFYISFSSGLSGTYNTSQIVIRDLLEDFPDRKIVSIDSLCASVGEGLLVLNAAMHKKNGMKIEELREWTEQNKTRARHWFTVKDLFHLKRGGRINSIEAIVGTALKIKPVLSTDDVGKLTVVTKIRGARAEMDFLLSKIGEEGIDLAAQTVIIGHGDNLKQAMELESMLRDKNLVKDIVIAKIGPIIGTHTGPGMLALTFMGDNRK